MTQAPKSARPGRPALDTVLERFERWARDTPDAPALLAGPDGLTYAELDARANRLAHHLLESGAPAHPLVAVATTLRPDLVVAVLAVLKAGGTYALLDAGDPHAARSLLAVLRADLLLTHTTHHARLDLGDGRRTLLLDAESARIAERPADPPARPGPGTHPPHGAEAGPPAAVLFTGSAEPRPVRAGHALLLAAHDGWAETARLTPEDRHLFTCGPDVTAFAAGWTRALCSGGSLVLPPAPLPLAEDLLRTVVTERVSVLHTDPAGALALLPDPGRVPLPARSRHESGPRTGPLRLVAVTGDRLHLDEQASVQAVLRPGARVLNVYGLAECGGNGTWFELPQLPRPLDDPERLSLLGTPHPGCLADVRDGQIHLTPPGGGDAVPTGDLGRLRPDGLLEFGGRIRDRFDLDGRPVDPHPLESAIRTHPRIGAAIVAAVPGGKGEHRLVAYIAPPHGEPPGTPAGTLADTGELRDHLAEKVPGGLAPRAVIRLRGLPRTRGGQEDRARVPRPPLLLAPTPPGYGAHTGSVKYGGASTGEGTLSCVVGCGALAIGVVARLVTNLLWPGSTDLTGIPLHWAVLFGILHVLECLAFGLGVMFLFNGRRRMLAQRRGRRLTTAAHLAIVYLLVSWWPQDNLYRLAAKQDWARQAALVYVFNVPLMIAAAVAAFYVTRRPVSPFDFDD
ncbi:AMP-binding protein [Streptomyces sp. NPDC057939]|uniref:AMP-binding protein n=1 Tax=Streptomyces sp. NPDC057939 TaxID=3346284 RepID=UPI0036EF5E7D